MLKAESTITSDKHQEPWSPELHNTVCIVSVKKYLLTQAITKIVVYLCFYLIRMDRHLMLILILYYC